MKTQIITLEAHDDLISVRDKLAWVKMPRVLLVWPKYESVNLRVLDLKVLQRHADALGAQLGLVTRRGNVRRDAEALGIPVFGTTSAAQKEAWPKPAPHKQRLPKNPRRDLRKIRAEAYPPEAAWRTSLLGRAFAFAVGVIAFVTVAGLFVPRATVTLYPQMQTQKTVLSVAASESFQSVSMNGNIPAQKLSVIVEAEQTLAIASEISIPKTKAKGIARFTNLSQGEVNIPAGTTLSTATDLPIQFVTLNATLLSPGADEFVEVPIEALKAGESGNVLAGSIIVVEGPLGLSIAVGNPSATTGGTDSKTLGATEADRAKLRDVVMENLRREAEAKMKAQISADDLLLLDTFEAAQVMEETFDPAEGEPGNSLKLKLQIQFEASYVSAKDLNQLVALSMNASIPVGFEAPGAPAFAPLTDPSTDNTGISHFEVEVSREIYQKIDRLQILALLRGEKIETAIQNLQSAFSLRQASQISLRPSWWKRLPLIPFNISIEVK
ncbi:MAG: baseplate J/gp47 family protein [Anaerolineales bacterium]|nr:baseplate J/gp47 family protein [Anaerolineales bacterium]